MPRAHVKPLPVALQQPRQAVGTAVAAGAVLVAVLLLMPLLRGPHVVRRLTLVNSTPYQVEVQVEGAPGTGHLDLGSVAREREIVLEDVIDQGARWTFRFSSGGVFAGEMELARRDIERDGWRVSIPPGVAEPLRDGGVTPSAG